MASSAERDASDLVECKDATQAMEPKRTGSAFRRRKRGDPVELAGETHQGCPPRWPVHSAGLITCSQICRCANRPSNSEAVDP